MKKNIKAEDVFNLLKQTTSISIVSNFLKKKGLHHSAQSWDRLYQDRISPYIQSGALTPADLLALLRDVEEYGRQHVFLFKYKGAKELLNQDYVTKVLGQNDMADLLKGPKVLDQPAVPTIADVRIDNPDKPALVVKVIEQRRYQKFVEEESTGDFTFIRKYELVKERAVNVFKLNSDGVLEIRVASHSNSSHYLTELGRLQKLVSKIIPDEGKIPLSLAKAKKKVWADRDALRDIIRYSDFTFKNDQGTTLRAASGSEEDDLFDDEGAVSGISEFINHDGYCDRSNIWFVADGKAALSKDVHVLLSGEPNEFALTAHCTKIEYDYVFSQLRHLNH